MFPGNMARILLVILTFVVLAESQFKRVGEPCCLETWEGEQVGKVFAAFQKSGKKFDDLEFLRAFDAWKDSFYHIYGTWGHKAGQIQNGTCGGQLNMKCNKVTKLCECNDMDPFKYTNNGDGLCIGEENQFCMNRDDPSAVLNPIESTPIECAMGLSCDFNPDWANRFDHCNSGNSSKKIDTRTTRPPMPRPGRTATPTTIETSTCRPHRRGNESSVTESPSVLVFMIIFALRFGLDYFKST